MEIDNVQRIKMRAAMKYTFLFRQIVRVHLLLESTQGFWSLDDEFMSKTIISYCYFIISDSTKSLELRSLTRGRGGRGWGSTHHKRVPGGGQFGQGRAGSHPLPPQLHIVDDRNVLRVAVAVQWRHLPASDTLVETQSDDLTQNT